MIHWPKAVSTPIGKYSLSSLNNLFHSEGVYTVQHEKVFKLENGFYLLYYYRPERWRLLQLYLKFLIPIVALMYFIKKNPFYQSYPIMLPGMVIVLFLTIFGMVKYSRVTNNLVSKVLMDPTGTELTFIY
jgi:hypothetical protein